ncbi:ArsR family transcriptional regulator [Kitasatospora sp. NBC_00374]|uniref:ArsR family transcriptional regulator n=1 Tax=Kitasatospora sp. NBC_00374 TaxID=2975964 RepID=UPI003243BB26
MLRIHFTADDLARTRLAPGADAAAELTISLQLLGGALPTDRLAPWRRGLRGQLGPHGRVLLELLAPGAGLPEFLHLPGGGTIGSSPTDTADVDQSLIDRHLDRLAVRRAPTPFTRALARRSTDALQLLGTAVSDYRTQAVDPYWHRIRAQVDADRALRGRALTDGGVERLLTTLHPRIRWRAPVLEVDLGPSWTSDVRLTGQGLLLQPVLLSAGGPVFGITSGPGGLPELLYPARPEEPLLPDTAPDLDALGVLLGRTRAAVLEALADTGGCSTGELARATGTAAATASQHAAVLRAAGLVLTRRSGSSVLHTLTPLGRSLLPEHPAGTAAEALRRAPKPR